MFLIIYPTLKLQQAKQITADVQFLWSAGCKWHQNLLFTNTTEGLIHMSFFKTLEDTLTDAHMKKKTE